jgi:tetratricopeptide (TPR) repeat protein
MDVDRYFEILSRAKAKAGDSVYGRRIDLISAECQPMKEIFAFSANYERGLAAARAGDGATAEACLRKAVACAQDNRSRADASYELGHVCLNLLKDNEKALAAYRQAMEQPLRGAGSAVRYHARMRAVGLLRAMKRYPEALQVLDAFDGKRHGYWAVESLIQYGKIAEDQGRWTDAAARYREALDVKDIGADQVKRIKERQRVMDNAAMPAKVEPAP